MQKKEEKKKKKKKKSITGLFTPEGDRLKEI